jgi:hypothetical protein
MPIKSCNPKRVDRQGFTNRPEKLAGWLVDLTHVAINLACPFRSA